MTDRNEDIAAIIRNAPAKRPAPPPPPPPPAIEWHTAGAGDPHFDRLVADMVRIIGEDTCASYLETFHWCVRFRNADEAVSPEGTADHPTFTSRLTDSFRAAFVAHLVRLGDGEAADQFPPASPGPLYLMVDGAKHLCLKLGRAELPDGWEMGTVPPLSPVRTVADLIEHIREVLKPLKECREGAQVLIDGFRREWRNAQAAVRALIPPADRPEFYAAPGTVAEVEEHFERLVDSLERMEVKLPAPTIPAVEPATSWPPKSGWSFRDGRVSLNGHVVKINAKPSAVLKVIAIESHKGQFATYELLERTVWKRIPQDHSNIRTELSNVRKVLRKLREEILLPFIEIPAEFNSVGNGFRLPDDMIFPVATQ